MWEGDIEAHAELVDTWMQDRGIPPKWSDWTTFQQVASMLGLLVEVDWGSQITSFFGMIRLKVAVKDPSKIPKERLVEINQKLFWINFKVEGLLSPEEEDNSGGRRGEEDQGEEDQQKEKQEDGTHGTDKSTPKHGGTGENREKGGKPGASASKDARIVPLWSSLFWGSPLEDLMPEYVSNFNGSNLLSAMNLVENEEETLEMKEMQQEAEDTHLANGRCRGNLK